MAPFGPFGSGIDGAVHKAAKQQRGDCALRIGQPPRDHLQGAQQFGNARLVLGLPV